jgi:two-component system sensor histidine kinase KdpD
MSQQRRKTPEELLREIQSEDPRAHKGYLKIFLGYASGVGKSFRMLDEARRRSERGQDVVVGALQPREPPEVQEILEKLELIPLKNGVAVDVDAILRRAPAVCFIDGLAYDNAPGSRHATRWEDVEELLDAGMKVVASINVQYVSELRDEAHQYTGKVVTDTVPVSFIKSADEIEIVDAPPEQPIQGTPEDQVDALTRAHRLSKLRELALLLAADVVERQLQTYLERHGIRQSIGTQERLLVCITARSNSDAMIGAARAIAEKFHGELIVAYVHQDNISDTDRAILKARLESARSAGARIEILDGDDPIEAILDFARSNGVTQLFIGHSQRSGWASRLRGTPVDRLIEQSRGMDVRVFPQ